uniref:Peptidase S1 domain-containing protein n=1 Tax=Parastrongyloides trichosuri TaxID=131310 RepID=A0A0N4ZP43_PARTI
MFFNILLFCLIIFYILHVKCQNWTTHPAAHLLITDGSHSTKDSSCSGTILGSKYILTAAHCLFSALHCKKKNIDFSNNYDNFKIPKYGITVEYDGGCSSTKKTCPQNNAMKKIGVEKIYIHNEYIKTNCKEADLAILELNDEIGNRGIILNTHISSLPDQLIGFGYGYDPHYEDNTYMYQEDFFNTVECKHDSEKRPKGTFCTDERQNNFCKGDSGAPLLLQNRTLYGVVSGGTNCNYVKKQWDGGKEESLKGNISFKVSNFINFICSIVQQDIKNPIEGCEKYIDVFNSEIFSYP